MKLDHEKKYLEKKSHPKDKHIYNLPNIRDVKGWKIYGQGRMPPHEND